MWLHITIGCLEQFLESFFQWCAAEFACFLHGNNHGSWHKNVQNMIFVFFCCMILFLCLIIATVMVSYYAIKTKLFMFQLLLQVFVMPYMIPSIMFIYLKLSLLSCMLPIYIYAFFLLNICDFETLPTCFHDSFFSKLQYLVPW